MKKKIIKTLSGLFATLVVVIPACADGTPPAIETNFQDLFAEKQWNAMDALAGKAGEALSVKEKVLYGNSLWFRGDFKRGLDVFREVEKNVPPQILPYLRMRIVLGLERTGQTGEALKEALALEDEKDDVLAPYVYYAIGRLSRSLGEASLAERAYRSMALVASDTEQKRTALRELFALSAADADDARALLGLEPLNEAALDVLEKTGPPYQAKDALLLAEASISQKQHEKVLEYLSNTAEAGKSEEQRISLLAARAHASLGRKREAADEFYGLASSDQVDENLAMEAISLLKEMARRENDGYAKELLTALTVSGKRGVRAGAMAALVETYRREGDEKQRIFWEDKLLESHPQNPLAVPIMWERGWGAWKESRPERAASFWDAALQAGPSNRDEAKLLYWLQRARKDLGQNTADITEPLRMKHPLDYYTLIALENPSFPVSEGKSALLEHAGHDLENWGFMIYARMHLLQEGSPGSVYRAALISWWLGDYYGSYLQAHAVYRQLPRDGSVPPELLDILFPLPYADYVRNASERFSVPSHDIWAIMRRESAFNPGAVSHAGAIGLMQLMPPTARENAQMLGLGDDFNLFDPQVNILLGTNHFKRLLGMFEKVEQAIAAYNAGQGRVKSWVGDSYDRTEWIEDIPFDETREFVRQVLANRDVYTYLIKKQDEEED